MEGGNQGDCDGNADACLDRLGAGGSAEQRRAAAHEVSDLLTRGLCENQLRDLLLYERGCCGAFERDGFDASGWLNHLRSRLADRR